MCLCGTYIVYILYTHECNIEHFNGEQTLFFEGIISE